VGLSDPSGLEWYDIDGKGTWEYSKDTPTRFVVRTNDEGEEVLVEVAGQKELLSFDGSSLKWMAGDGSTMVWDAVAGELSDGETQTELQDVADTGPIPEGSYRVDFNGTKQRESMNIIDKIRYPQATWGNYFVRIEPYKVANGRSGFTIHGGAVPGSAGCIDLHKNNDAFFGMMLSRGKGQLPLIVRYK
jgi:hypothetical protein